MISTFGGYALAKTHHRSDTEYVYVTVMNTLLRLVNEDVLTKERVTKASILAAVEKHDRKIADVHFVTQMIYRDFQELVQ